MKVLLIAFALVVNVSAEEKRGWKGMPTIEKNTKLFEDAGVAIGGDKTQAEATNARVTALRERMILEMKALRPPLDRLIVLTPRYASGVDFDARTKERKKLREDLRAGHADLMELKNEFRKIREVYNLHQGAMILTKAAKKKPDQTLMKNLRTLLDLGDLNKDGLRDFSFELNRAIEEDQAAYEKALRQREDERQHLLFLGGMVFIFACLVAGIYFVRRT